MRHISTKDDWYYELRPLMIRFIGISGIVSKFVIADTQFANLSLVCGMILIGISHLIFKWRREYRAKLIMR